MQNICEWKCEGWKNYVGKMWNTPYFGIKYNKVLKNEKEWMELMLQNGIHKTKDLNDEWSQLVVHLYSPLNLFCEYFLLILILIFWSHKVPSNCLKRICYYFEQHQLDNDQCKFWINCHMFPMKNMISTHKMILYEKNGQLDFE